MNLKPHVSPQCWESEIFSKRVGEMPQGTHWDKEKRVKVKET